MEENGKHMVFEENRLPRKATREILARNARGKLALQHINKQLERGKEDYVEEFNRTRTGLLQRARRTSSFCREQSARGEESETLSSVERITHIEDDVRRAHGEFSTSWDSRSVRSQDLSESSCGTERNTRLRRSSSFTSPTLVNRDVKQAGSRTRRITLCSRMQFSADVGMFKRSSGADSICEAEGSRMRSLSEILPPVSLPPIHLQGMVADNRRQKKQELPPEKKIARRKVSHGTAPANVEDLTKDLADCRYLRGNHHR